MDTQYHRYIALILIAVAVKLFFDHRKPTYKGVYGKETEMMSPVKNNMFRTFWVELFPILVYGLAAGDSFWNSENPLNSWIGRTAVVIAGFFTYYEFFQPYVVMRTPAF